jgi:hypothetical protein
VFLVLGLRVVGRPHQLHHDLRVGLPLEAEPVDRAGRSHLLEQGLTDRRASRSGGPYERAVDVEENELLYAVCH